MKNIHLIPTDKPSKLYEGNLGELVIIQYKTPLKSLHIYITSDEQAKEGDWGYIPFQGGDVKLVGKYFADDWKKIILTTDQDLIADGIQDINDDFLEWFVKNPSCEEVEVTYGLLEPFKSEDKGYLIHCPDNDPKEEPKPHSFCETPEEKCTMNYCDENGCQNRKRILVEKKNNELEVEKLADIFLKEEWQKDDDQVKFGIKVGFVEGYNKSKENYEVVSSVRELYQYKLGLEDGYNKAKKTFYTEEEVLWMVLNNPYKFEDNIKEWFELFKKK